MLQITEFGKYTTKGGQVFTISMVQHDGGTDGEGYEYVAGTCYNLDIDGRSKLLLWPNWYRFASEVNRLAGEEILQPEDNPLQTEAETETALDAFMRHSSAIEALLESIRGYAIEDRFCLGPEDVQWDDVGTAAHVRSLLQNINDMLYQQGEYAE